MLWRDELCDTPATWLGPLYAWAEQKGLVRKYGEDFVKAIIEAPFLVAQSMSGREGVNAGFNQERPPNN